jgi:hypothetical protein
MTEKTRFLLIGAGWRHFRPLDSSPLAIPRHRSRSSITRPTLLTTGRAVERVFGRWCDPERSDVPRGHDICAAAEIMPGEMKCVFLGEMRILLVNVDGRIYATSDVWGLRS